MKARRTAPGFFIIPAALLYLLLFAAQAGAGPPAIKIVLEFDKDYYGFDEPVTARVTIRNITAETILLSKGFGARNPVLEMRVIDPAKNLLKLPPRPGLQTETPDTPPLPHVKAGGGIIEAAPCEGLQGNLVSTSPKTDLRGYFDFALPGIYSAQVQKSTMVFKGPAGSLCDVKNPEWVGMLKSNTAYIFVEGKTPVEIIPAVWLTAWQSDSGNVAGTLEVRIYPRTGVGLGDYDMASIRLNNIKAVGHVENRGTHLSARFDRKAAIGSLAMPLQAGRPYPVVISGRLKNGTPFGGARRITVRTTATLPPPVFIR